VTREGALDRLEVKVEVSEEFFFDEMKRLQDMEKTIEHKLENLLAFARA